MDLVGGQIPSESTSLAMSLVEFVGKHIHRYADC
jgi:hypothetical protein